MAIATLCVVNSICARTITVGVHNYEPLADIGDDKPSGSHFAKNYKYQWSSHAVKVLRARVIISCN